MNRFFVVFAVLTFAGCQKPDGPARVQYTCEGGYQFTAELLGGEAEIELGGQKHRLQSVNANSGAKFSDGVITYWISGSSALLTAADISYKECTATK